MTRPHSAAGFTLLEILVALAVFGCVMIGLSQGVQFGLHARSMQSRTVDARSGLETTDRVLRAVVEQMDPGTTDRPATVSGTEHTLGFITTLAGGGQPVDAALGVDAAHRLVLRWAPRLHAVRIGPPPALSESELLGDVDHIEFAYWEPPDDHGGRWVQNWHGTRLPGLIRMRIVFGRGDRRQWPEIILTPMRQPSGA
jgi:general secretion pathway protein J